MAGRRVARLGEQLRREITDILRREAKDPRIGDVIITDVEVTRDLAYARVYVQVPGDEAARAQTLEGLRAAAPFVRTELGRRLHIRRVPELRFLLDTTLERALRIERLLREIRSEGGSGATGEGGPDA